MNPHPGTGDTTVRVFVIVPREVSAETADLRVWL